MAVATGILKLFSGHINATTSPRYILTDPWVGYRFNPDS